MILNKKWIDQCLQEGKFIDPKEEHHCNIIPEITPTFSTTPSLIGTPFVNSSF